MTRGLALGWRVLVWSVIVLGLGALAAVVVAPRIAGATPYAVTTGSMRPAYPPGTLVVVRPVDVGSLRVGDVVTYQRASGRATVVTHRIVAVEHRLDGEPVLRTRGDANDAVDPAPVRAVQVRGRLWYAVPHLGRVNRWLTGDQRRVASYVVVTGLLGYAAFMFAGAARDRARSRRGGAHAARSPVTAPEEVAQ